MIDENKFLDDSNIITKQSQEETPAEQVQLNSSSTEMPELTIEEQAEIKEKKEQSVVQEPVQEEKPVQQQELSSVNKKTLIPEPPTKIKQEYKIKTRYEILVEMLNSLHEHFIEKQVTEMLNKKMVNNASNTKEREMYNRIAQNLRQDMKTMQQKEEILMQMIEKEKQK